MGKGGLRLVSGVKEKPLLGDRIMVAIVNLNQAAEPIIRDHVGQSGSRATQRCTRGRKIGEQRMQRVEGMCVVGWGGVWMGGLSRRDGREIW